MKKITLFITLIAFTFGFSQTIPVTFDEGISASNWYADSGLTSATVEDIVDDNPDHGNVGKIVSSIDGDPWQNAQLLLEDNYIDLTTNKVITLDVYSTNPQNFLLKLEGSLNGGGITEKGFSHSGNGWETIEVDFNSPNGTNPVPNDQYRKFVIFPCFNTVADYWGLGAFDSTVYIDNFSGTVGDAYTPPLSVDLPFDFETSPITSDFTGFDGGSATVEAVAAPQSTGNTSTKLLKIVRNTGAAWAGVFTIVDTPLDFSTNSTITAKIWTDAPIGTKIMFKTEQDGVPENNSGEKNVFTTVTGEWEDLVFDFSGVTNANQNKLVLIPDNGSVGDGTATSTFYIDDIAQAAPEVAYDLPFDFETSPITSDFTGFDGGSATVEAVAAPQSTGNTSTKLLKIVRNTGAAWAGVFTIVDTPLDFSTNSTITAKIWTDAPIGTKIMFKTEQDGVPENNSGEKNVFTTVTGEWEDLVFDFSGVTNANQNKLVLIPDNGSVGDGTATSTFYIDDIAQAAPETTPQTITVSVDVSANPGGVNIVTNVTDEWAEYVATVDPNNSNIYSYTFAEGVTSAEYVWKVYTGGDASIQESLVSLVGGGAIENNLAATLPTGSGINTNYSTNCNRTVASTTGEFVEATYIFNSFKRVGVTYTELVLNADAGNSYAIDYSVNDYSEYHGPGAVDNGDGTYTVIVDPTSAFTYLWYNISTSTQEDLSACDSPNRNHVAGENESDTFGDCPIVGPTTSAPTPPARDAADVVSLYSDVYTNSTNWGAIEVFGGSLTNIVIDGDNTYEMTSGFQYNYYSPPGTFEDLSSMTHMHVDFFVDGDFVDGSVLGVQLLGDAGEEGSGENTYNQTAFQANTWVSVDVPLANFNNGAPLIPPLYEDIKLIQVNLQGPAGTTFPTVYLDNLYFYTEATQGLDDNVFNTVKMFPNPAKDTVQFSVNSNENLDIEIFDMLGKSVLRVNDVQNEVNISDLNSGLYFVQMTLGTQQATKKLIIN
ncbi:T9SS type A sorting domain-containing protein [Flavobacteriaceae bacterium]|nr:T9SS type A sorting domain-containing protein [Flavobacteriaceae bacterium]